MKFDVEDKTLIRKTLEFVASGDVMAGFFRATISFDQGERGPHEEERQHREAKFHTSKRTLGFHE